MKRENIVSYTAEEMAKLKDETDWDRLNNMTEEEIEAIAASDPDAPPITDWSGFVFVDPTPKKAISIRLDKDMLDYFKKEGPGYQSRINQVLRHYWMSNRTTSGSFTVSGSQITGGSFTVSTKKGRRTGRSAAAGRKKTG